MAQTFRAVIHSIYGAYYIIRDLNDESLITLKAKLQGKMRSKKQHGENLLAVGDEVEAEFNQNDSSDIEATILDIFPRKNSFVRSAYKRTQPLAANIDAVLVIAAVVKPHISFGFIDRVLVEALNQDLEARIIFNKNDLRDSIKRIDDFTEYTQIYQDLGYHTYFETLKEGASLELTNYLKGSKRFLIVGQSGVGKSTFLNAIIGSKLQSVSEITKQKGRHTTTNPLMVMTAYKNEIIDIPGVREFGLQHLNALEVAYGFEEFREVKCKYENCIHLQEPGCGVKDKFKNKMISEKRYRSYLNILESLSEKYRIRKGNYWS